MNERIKQLALQSQLVYETTECVNEVLMDAHHNIAIHFGFAKHFGIEE